MSFVLPEDSRVQLRKRTLRRLTAELIRDSTPADGEAILDFHADADRTDFAARDPGCVVDISGFLDDQVILIRETPIIVEVAHVIVPGESLLGAARRYP